MKATTYVVPTTGAQIMADTLTNTAADLADEPDCPQWLAAIAHGEPIVRVHASSDGYRHGLAIIMPGVLDTDGRFWPSYLTPADDKLAPRVKFRTADGRLTDAQNARRAVNRFFALEDATRIEYAC